MSPDHHQICETGILLGLPLASVTETTMFDFHILKRFKQQCSIHKSFVGCVEVTGGALATCNDTDPSHPENLEILGQITLGK